MSIRVAIFDDNATRRDGVKLLLDASEGFLCAGAFENFNNGIADIHSCNPDVIIMDIDMPGINGIEAVRMIKTNYPQLPVMMQTVFDHDDKVFDSILAGASGYLLKKAAPLKLLEAIREIHEGGAPMTPEIAVKVLHFFRNKEQQKVTNDMLLTEKEKEVLSDLVAGLSYKMIASKQAISYHTVNFHIRNIYKKMHVNSVGEAVAKALKEKMI